MMKKLSAAAGVFAGPSIEARLAGRTPGGRGGRVTQRFASAFRGEHLTKRVARVTTTLALIATLSAISSAAQSSARPGQQRPSATYSGQITKWRTDYDADLKREGGWLSVAGLFILKPGRNAFGAAATNDIVLPKGAVAEKAGSFALKEGRVFFELADHVNGQLNGQPATRGELRPASADPSRPADVLRLGRLSLAIHRSGPRLAIRLRDPEGPVRRSFTSTRWFPVDRRWRVTAAFVPFDTPRAVRVLNLLGDEVELKSPGLVRFTWAGRACTMLALEGSEGLWFVFTDQTAGVTTYKAARFLDAAPAVDGRVELDFLDAPVTVGGPQDRGIHLHRRQPRVRHLAKHPDPGV